MPECPEIPAAPLPTFLPRAGEQLQPIAGHDTLASVLGLALAHLRAMHPTTSSPPDENARASAHLLKLFIQDPVVQSLLPADPPASQPTSEELPALPALQARLASVENAVANLAANAAASAAKERPRPTTSIGLQLTNVPTTRFGSSIQYMTQELHEALKAENVCYAELDVIRGPYWDDRHAVSCVKDTATLTFVFRDYPDFSIAENLLRREWLYAFGHGCGIVGMDGRGRYPPKEDYSDKPEYISLK
jgi:hypothetical protein